MLFAKRLREGVVRGDITCSVRIWMSPRVTEGRRYRMGDGEIEIESVTPIGFPDITPELARESGFLGVLDLLKVAKHGKGNNIYLIRFHYIPPRGKRRGPNKESERSSTRKSSKRPTLAEMRRRLKTRKAVTLPLDTARLVRERAGRLRAQRNPQPPCDI
jgi:hypothetical protein